MLKVNDYIRHQRFGICKITGITDTLSYVLRPVYKDKSLEITISTLSAEAILHQIITSDKALDLIKTMVEIEPIWLDDFRRRKAKFEEIMNGGTYEDKVAVLKTAYLIKHNRFDKAMKLTNTDTIICGRIENYIFEELAISLSIPYCSVETYIENYMNEIK